MKADQELKTFPATQTNELVVKYFERIHADEFENVVPRKQSNQTGEEAGCAYHCTSDCHLVRNL